MGWRSGVLTGSLCALLCAGASRAIEPTPHIVQVPDPERFGVVSERVEPLGADDVTVTRRMAAICHATLQARLTYTIDGAQHTDTTGAFAFYQDGAGTYVTLGVPSRIPLQTAIAVELEGGAPATILERTSSTIAVARVPKGTVPLLLDVALGQYAATMGVPKHRLRDCDALGATTVTQGTLTLEQEFLAADCERSMTYRGPSPVFGCPVTDDVRVWAFVNVFQNRYVLVDEPVVPPTQYHALITAGSTAAEWTDLLGTPVFDPTGDKNYAFGIVIDAQRIYDRSWILTVAAAEYFIPYVHQRVLAHEDKPLKTAGDSPVKAAP